MPSPFRLAFAIAALATPLLAQGKETQTKIYNLSTLLTTAPYSILDKGKTWLALPRVLPLSAITRHVHFSAVGGFPTPVIDPAVLESVLESACCPNPAAATNLRQRFLLNASQADHARVQDLLTALAERLRPGLELRIHRIKAIPDAPILTAAETATFLGKHPPVATLHHQIRGDVPFSFFAGIRRSILRDLDVEVAQESKMFDPKVDTIDLGLKGAVVATGLNDGRILVHAGVLRSSLAKIHNLDLHGKDGGRLQQPEVHSRSACTTAILEDGGALVLAVADANYATCLIQLRKAKRQEQPRQGVFHAIPLGDRLHPRARFYGPGPMQPPGSEGPEFEDIPPSDPQTVSAWLTSLLGDDAEGLALQIFANHLLILGSPSQADRIRTGSKRLLEHLGAIAAARRSIAVEHRCGLVPTSKVQDFTAGRLAPEVLAAATSAGGAFGCLPGHSFQQVQGMERLYLRDWEVEIAQDAEAGNPVVSALFTGRVFCGRIQPDPAGGFRIGGRFLLSEGTPEPLASRLEAAEDLQMVTNHVVQGAFADVELLPGKWCVLATAPHPKDPARHAVLLVRATVR